LRRILESPEFRSTKRCQDFLTFIVGQTLAGFPLKERTVGAGVFGRDAAYDTNEDGIVRIKASEVRKRLGLYYAGSEFLSGAKKWKRQSFPAADRKSGRAIYNPAFGRADFRSTWRSPCLVEIRVDIRIVDGDWCADGHRVEDLQSPLGARPVLGASIAEPGSHHCGDIVCAGLLPQ
jgi:hypothetical protein